MKSENGVTITSIMIYVIVLTIVVVTVGRITTYFYKNVNTVTSSTDASSAYLSFNTYFTNEINTEKNQVKECVTNDDTGVSYITFEGTQNKYIFKGKNIYKDKVKIAKNIDSCKFSYEETTGIITVDMTIDGKQYSNSYTQNN